LAAVPPHKIKRDERHRHRVWQDGKHAGSSKEWWGARKHRKHHGGVLSVVIVKKTKAGGSEIGWERFIHPEDSKPSAEMS